MGLQVKDKNILIVGGAGYVGSHVTKLLQNRGYSTTVIDDLSTGHKKFALGNFIQGKAGDSKLIRKILKDNKINVVMHFAAKALVGESMNNPSLYFENNFIETHSLLESMRSEGVMTFVFSSTCSTFGEPNEIPIHENIPQKPVNPYGLSKLMVENMLKEYVRAYKMSAVALRYFNAAGADPDGVLGEEHDPETHLIPNIIKAALGQKPLIVFGNDYPTPDGSCIRDYVHINDLGNAHILAMEYLLKHEGIYEHFNLGSEHGHSVFEVIQSVEQSMERKVEFKIGKRREGDPPRLIADSKKAKSILGWKTTYSIDDIVKTAVNYFLKNKKK